MKDRSVLVLFLIILLSFLGLTACNRSPGVEAAREPDSGNDHSNVLTDDEKDFATYASEMHVGEIDMAKQAKQKSTNEDVRNYADSVIRLHSDALKDLSDNLGRQSKQASWDTKSHMDVLGRMSGAEFDREFILLMIADHRSARDTFREEMGATQNGNLKKYLQEALPGLEKGLTDGQEVQSKLPSPRITN